jgi:hypothetical protein
MAKKSSLGESELNLDSLMDAVTNVVGVLMIVFVIMALNTARTLQKILTDLPAVTKEEHQQMVEKIKVLPPPPADPKKLEEDKKIVENKLKIAIEQLKTVDTADIASKMKFMDLDAFRKQLEDAKKLRELQKVEVDKLLTELERLKAMLDQTPIYQPPPATFVRLPNPRPFPEKANETRVLVAKQGTLFFNQPEFTKPILEGLEKVKAQFEYKEVKIDPFMNLLEKTLGNKTAAQQAWPEIGSFANTFQMEPVAQAYRILATANLAPNKAVLEAVGDISLTIGATMPAVAEAIVAATQGNYAKWVALDTSKDPTKPNIKATAAGGKVSFTWGAGKAVEVKAAPRDVLNYFVKELAETPGFKNRSRTKTIYDAAKLQQILDRAASNPTFSGSYIMKPVHPPAGNFLQLALTPKPGGGETLEQMRAPGSNYQRTLRQIKGDPNGVAFFQVMPDAFITYLEARKIADEIGVAATWDFLARLDIALPVPGYEVQRFAPVPVAPPVKPGTVPAVRIAAPRKGLD